MKFITGQGFSEKHLNQFKSYFPGSLMYEIGVAGSNFERVLGAKSAESFNPQLADMQPSVRAKLQSAYTQLRFVCSTLKASPNVTFAPDAVDILDPHYLRDHFFVKNT